MNNGNSEKWNNPNNELTRLELLEKVMYGDNSSGEQDQAYEDLKKQLKSIDATNIFKLFKSNRESLKDKSLYEKVCLYNMKYFMFSSEEISEFQQALTTPKISDNKVEELFDIVKDWTYQDYSNIRYVTKFSIEDRLKRKKALNQLKVKFQQMQQEIESMNKRKMSNTNQELQKIIWKLEELPASDLLTNIVVELCEFNEKLDWRIAFPTMDKIAKENTQYKQLLDKIDLEEPYDLDKHCIRYTFNTECDFYDIPQELYNILKELKLIGGNQ